MGYDLGMTDDVLTSRPFMSVIMAVRNEAEALPATLAALERQTLDRGHWELIAADGDSDDATATIARSSGALVVENPDCIAAAGLNRALALAQGDVIVRLDGHTVLAPDYLARVHDALKQSGAACVGGLQQARGRGLWGRAYALATGTAAGHGGAAYRAGAAGDVDTVYLGAWPRRVLLEAGGFDESLARNQDDELAMRIRARGGRVRLDPRLRSEYSPRESVGALFRQYFGYGLWKPPVLVRYPGETKLRHLLPPALVGGLVLTSIFMPTAALIILALYLCAVSLATIRVAARQPGLIPCTALVLIVMHIGYGLGFFCGIPRALARMIRGRSRLAESMEQPA